MPRTFAKSEEGLAPEKDAVIVEVGFETLRRLQDYIVYVLLIEYLSYQNFHSGVLRLNCKPQASCIFAMKEIATAHTA